jgi:aspartate aminotransferase
MPTAMVEFSNRILKVQPSLTLGITAKAKQMKAQGIQVISFGAGEPDFDTPEPIKQAAIASLNKGFTKYTPENGTLELRKAICDKFKRDNELDYTPDQIVVSCGAKHSLYNLFQVLLNEGDEVIIPSPFWLSYPEMATLAGAKSVIVPTKRQDHYLMSAGDLEKAITPRTKILVLNSPSNPAGVVYSKERMLEILSVARKHSFFIISDEIYEKLIFDGMKHYSPAQLCPDLKSRIIVVNGRR